MPTFNIVKESKPNKTFRVASIIGKFDLQSEKITEQFQGDIDLPKNWQIGLNQSFMFCKQLKYMRNRTSCVFFFCLWVHVWLRVVDDLKQCLG